MNSKNTKEKIELTVGSLETLAELVFLGELVINDERDEQRIKKYHIIKEQVVREYISTLSTEKQRELSDEQSCYDYFLTKHKQSLQARDTATLLYVLSDKLVELAKDKKGRRNALDNITDWRGISRELIQKLIAD
ncbi:MAG: hypothetical protein FWC80_03305 [Firmicutes bacterium]|nr:hypothetical protein [Bacillota bacterium]